LRDNYPLDQAALEAITNYLSTELWDRGFSQSGIKASFEAAVTELVGYATGEERRGDGDPDKPT
jgi:hypothetical protein